MTFSAALSTRLVMRVYARRDLPQMASRLRDLHHFAISENQALKNAEEALVNSPSKLCIGLFDRRDSVTLIGEVEATRVGQGWSLNYHTISAFTRQGYMEEALIALLPFFRSTLSAKFLSASVTDDTESRDTSMRLLGRLGFQREATQRHENSVSFRLVLGS